MTPKPARKCWRKISSKCRLAGKLAPFGPWSALLCSGAYWLARSETDVNLDELFNARLKLHRSYYTDLEAEVAQSRAQIILNGDDLRLQQLAVSQQHPQLLTAQCLHMHRAIKPHSHHLHNTAGIVSIGFVDLCLQHRSHMPLFNTYPRRSCFSKSTEQPLRQRSSFQSDPLEAVRLARQNC